MHVNFEGARQQSVPADAVAGAHRSRSAASARSRGRRETAESTRFLLPRRKRYHHHPGLDRAGRHGRLLRHRHAQGPSSLGIAALVSFIHSFIHPSIHSLIRKLSKSEERFNRVGLGRYFIYLFVNQLVS